MDPKHPLTPDAPGSNNKLTRGDLERIANPMSVILGYTQLLKRRVGRGQTIDNEELLRVLSLIEQASRSMITGLAQVSEKARSNNEDISPDP